MSKTMEAFGVAWRIVWTEDDATPGLDGHETIHDAWRRRYGVELPTDASAYNYEDRDDVYLYRHGDRLALLSYPGNDCIAEREVTAAGEAK